MSEAPIDYRGLMNRALLEIRDLKARLARQEAQQAEPIAIVGMACRFPGSANSAQAYWDLLRNGVDAISEVPAQRWDLSQLHDADNAAPGKMCSRFGGFIDDVDAFDAAFFGISPREAESMDPHQRVLLEVCWEALEHANLLPDSLFGGNTGVYIGVSSMDQVIQRMGEAPLADIGPYHGTGCAMAPIAGRVSYVFGLNGPSFVVDTACSSSLLSLHLAAEGLRRRECDAALAGGVHLLFHPGYSVAFSKAGMLAPDGRCKTFDASANGYVRGEGCGVVVLKRLSDALRDGDAIVALLRGSAVNQDGASGGLTVPSGPSQEQVLRQALARAGLQPEQVSYVEAHGTGTPLGDPIEIGALSQVYRQPLLVGSVKANIGHLEASAGIASVMKVALALQHRQIPPQLHLRQPNPMIRWNDIAVRVPTELSPWPRPDQGEAVAGISAFGFSGTNVHMLLSAPPPANEAGAPAAAEGQEGAQPRLLVLSARTLPALRSLAQRWAEGPLRQPQLDLEQACALAARCRTPFAQRLSLVADSVDQARAALDEFAAHGEAAGVRLGQAQGARPQVAFLFTGQGSQYVNMGRDLYTHEPVFRAAMDECDRLLQPELGESLTALIYPEPADQPRCAARLDGTGLAQPALFALGYALAQLWQARGIRPAALLGHSVGEYVAAHLAGVFSLADGLRLIAARGRLMQALPAGGAMAALLCDPAQVQALLQRYEGTLSVAAYNGPRNTVVSGPAGALDALLQQAAAQGIEARRLVVSHAFHSALMEPMLAQFRAVAQSIRYSAPQLPLISNVTADVLGAGMASADYWVRHVREPVRFAASLQTLHSLGPRCWLELGPSATLTDMARHCVDPAGLGLLASLRKGQPARDTVLSALGGLWVHGAMPDWAALYPRLQRDLRLPAYPFARRSFWPAASQLQAPRNGLRGLSALNQPLLARRFRNAAQGDTLFETVYSLQSMPFLDDHRVFGKLVVSGASQLSMVLSAAALTDGIGAACSLSEVLFPAALVVPEEGEQAVQLVIGAPGPDGSASFRLVGVSQEGAPVQLHARGRIAAVAAAAGEPADLRAVWERCGETIDVQSVYALQRERHIVVGPDYQWLRALRRGQGEVIASLGAPASLAPRLGDYSLHPGLIDSCFGALVMAQPMQVAESFIPFGVEALHFHAPGPQGPLLAHAVVRHHDARRLVGDIHLYTEDGRPVATLIGLEGRSASQSALLATGAEPLAAPALYQLDWQPLAAPAGAAPAGAAPTGVVTGPCLIFGDGLGLGDALAARLRQTGVAVNLVRLQPDVQDLQPAGSQQWALNPGSATAMRQLLQECASPASVIYLWGLDGQPDPVRFADTAGAAALQLLQALPAPARLWLVSRGCQSVHDDAELQAPQQALLWGLGQTAAAERPELDCICLDLQPGADLEHSCADLLAAMAQEPQERRLAVRSGRVHVARLQRLPDTAPLPAAMPPGGTCLITGASGALGQALARWLARQGQRHLDLLSRGPLEPAFLEELAALGASVQCHQADVADLPALTAVLARIRHGAAPLQGVFHLAGQLDNAVLDGLDPRRFAQAQAAKAQGAWHLHGLTRDMALPCFVLFSSVASLLDEAGQASYASANAFLDALARHRRGLGLAGLSLNWGPWSGTGMAARLPQEQQDRLQALGFASLDAQAALALMGGLLDGHAGAQVGVLALDWSRYLEQRPGRLLQSLQPPAAAQAATAALRQRLEEAADGARKPMLTAALLNLVSQVLRLQPGEVSPRQRLFDLGVDSLLAVELKNRLQALLGLTLSTTLLFDYPTLDSLSDHLLARIAPAAPLAEPPAAADGAGAAADLDVDVAQLSEEAAQSLLLAQLEKLEARLP